MATLDFTKRELDLLGMTEDSDEMNKMMRGNILQVVEMFAEQGHSGSSASYAIGILEKVLRYEPVTPLTGEDSEWMEISEGLYQNNRCPRVFKENGEAYDIDGKVFWEWYTYDLEEGEEGYPGTRTFKSHFTNKDSRVPVTFPYTPTTEYVEVEASS